MLLGLKFPNPPIYAIITPTSNAFENDDAPQTKMDVCSTSCSLPLQSKAVHDVETVGTIVGL
jgi:hypothetical protein